MHQHAEKSGPNGEWSNGEGGGREGCRLSLAK